MIRVLNTFFVWNMKVRVERPSSPHVELTLGSHILNKYLVLQILAEIKVETHKCPNFIFVMLDCQIWVSEGNVTKTISPTFLQRVYAWMSYCTMVVQSITIDFSRIFCTLTRPHLGFCICTNVGFVHMRGSKVLLRLDTQIKPKVTSCDMWLTQNKDPVCVNDGM